MEFIERVPLRPVHYLNQMSYDDFKQHCRKMKNDKERKTQFDLIKSYCRSMIKAKGEIKRLYTYPTTTPLSQGSRLYCGSSIQGLKKVFRGLLMKHTTDIDMKNAHPVILRYICHINGIECPYLEYYINNRSEVLKSHTDMDEDDAKTLYLQALNDDKRKTSIRHEIFRKYDAEMKKLQKTITKLECYKEIVDSVPIERKYNWEGSAINRIMCKFENDILQVCINYLRNKNLEVAAPMFDGCMPYGNHYENSELLQQITEEVENKFPGLNMVWAYKNHDNTIIIPDNFVEPLLDKKEMTETKAEKKEINGAKNDLEAAEIVYKLYPHWIFCKGVLYVFNENTGIWEDNKTAYYDVIKRYTSDLYVMSREKNGDWKVSSTKSYGNTVSLMDKIPILMPTLCTNNNWIRDKQNSSLGKLLFNNGYYDYHKGLFYDKETYGFNPEILFMGKVHHDFTPFTDDELEYMEDIRKRFFYDTLGEDVGDYFILNLARGLAGDMMKRILFALGATNTGKTVLCEALTATCGDYIGSFNAENLAYRNSSNDEAQIMRWALLLRYKRIIFSNEMKSSCDLNGNMIKKISSGGDTLIGRRHCQEEEEFNTHFLPICFANDIMKIKPYDDAVNGRVRIVSYTKQFVEGEPSNELELKMDKNIKQEIKTLRFQRVFMGLLVKAYNKFYTDDERVETEPAEVMIAKDEWVGQGATPIDAFFEDFEVTNNPSDYVRSKDIEDWMVEKQLGITMKKFGMEMKKLCIIRKYENVKNEVKKLGGKPIRVWFGIKIPTYDDDEPEKTGYT